MRAAALAGAALALAGCAGAPAVSDLLEPPDRGLASIQMRRYENVGTEEMVRAAVSALQDFGFQVSASDLPLGVIVATRGYQKTFGEYHWEFWQGYFQMLKNFFTLQWHAKPPEGLARLAGPPGLMTCVTVTPLGSGSMVRVSLHRVVSRPTGEPIVVWAEAIEEPEPYAKFFAVLAQALNK